MTLHRPAASRAGCRTHLKQSGASLGIQAGNVRRGGSPYGSSLSHWTASVCGLVSALVIFGTAWTCEAATSAEDFRPHSRLGIAELIASVSRAPDVVSAEREVKLREAASFQAHLLPNPTLDGMWASIPIGETNPKGLERPLARVPNYRIGISYTFPIGKRGPLQAARGADVRAASSRRCAIGRRLALELAATLGSMAIAELRIAALGELVEAAREHERQVQARLSRQLASGLEFDRAAIERGRFEQQLRAAESDLSEYRAVCSAYVGRSCLRFDSAEDARQYLLRWVEFDIERLLSNAGRSMRPEVLALLHAEESARHEQVYFRRQRLPDPTVRVGFVHDQFWVSGAQPSALELSLALPLPIFDHGQAGVRAASVAAAGFADERRALEATTQAVVPELRERLQAQRRRRKDLIDSLIPRAKAMLDDVVRAYDTRLLSMSDVIQARRAVLELLLEEVDGLADAYSAVLGLRAQIAESDHEGCSK